MGRDRPLQRFDPASTFGRKESVPCEVNSRTSFWRAARVFLAPRRLQRNADAAIKVRRDGFARDTVWCRPTRELRFDFEDRMDTPEADAMTLTRNPTSGNYSRKM